MKLGMRIIACKRDVSLHIKMAKDSKANDTFLTIIEAREKSGINLYHYFRLNSKNISNNHH